MKKHIKEYLLDTNNCIYYSNALKKREEKRSSEEKRILHIVENESNVAYTVHKTARLSMPMRTARTTF